MVNSSREDKLMREKRAYATRNLYLSKLCRKLLDTLIDVLAHSANLSMWAASYDIYIKHSILNEHHTKHVPDKKIESYAKKYKEVLAVIDEVKMYLDDNKIMENIKHD
jgi:hypothetical protein